MKKILKDTLALVLITLVAVSALSFAYELTKDAIADAEATERIASFYEVYATAADFRDADKALLEAYQPAIAGVTVSEALYALDPGGDPKGCVLSVTSANGYGGDIVLSVGINADGTITGVKVTSMSETSGLGAKCTDESWIAQFRGICAQAVAFVKDGKAADNEIDAITSATVTTKAVTEAVNGGLAFARDAFGYGKE